MYHGVAVPFYAHEYAEFSLAEWEVLFDAVLSTGIETGTYAEVAAFSKNPPAVTDATDDAWEPYLVQGTSYPAFSFIGAGGSSSATATGGGVSQEFLNSTNLPEGRDFGTKRYQDDGDIIGNYIHTDFPNR